MDYEKKYKNALEWARQVMNGEIGFIRKEVEKVFPELKESEDEKIRKELLQIAKKSEDTFYMAMTLNKRKHLIAWLEKQGEQKYAKKDVDNAYLKGVTDTKNEIDKQYEANYQIRKDIATFIFNYKGDIKDRAKWMNYLGIKVSFVENQGEQKPANKIEPKFHKGEWVVWNNKILCYIDDIYQSKESLMYTITDTNDMISIYSVKDFDNNAYLWTIQDAKDGDVLCYKNEISLYKHDIQNYTKQEIVFGGFVYYCCYDGKRFITNSLYSLTEQDKMNIHLATKEQCNLLFQKMKEAGYKWDANKKELKILEGIYDY